MKDFLKKYKTQIFNIITIFLILEFAVYPGLTAANTFSNILAGIGLLLLIVWGGLELYRYITSDNKPELKQFQAEWDEHLEKVQSETKAKAPKKKSVVKIDVTNAKNWNEVEGIVNPIVEGRVKVSVETTKETTKPKPKAQPKKEKVMGEYQLNNKEKVRKSLYKPKTK
jgi:hypothetical protein